MVEVEWSSSIEAAETYERVLVPALFERWAGPMLRAGHVKVGNHVLDVACGTGVVAREALNLVGDSGRVVGLDVDQSMLEVARRSERRVEWKIADAAALPFDDESFDVVVCQAGLMFFADQVKAMTEVRRVLRSDGRAVVHVWAQCDAQDDFADVLEKHAGQKAADNYRTPWNLKNPTHLMNLIKEADFPRPQLSTEQGTADYPSLDLFLEGASGILVSDTVNTARLRHDSGVALEKYIRPDGTMTFPEPAHIVIAAKH